MTRETEGGGGRDGCAHMLERLSDFHDGRYGPGSPEATEVEEHLATCPRCAELLADYRFISGLAKCLREKSCVPRKGEDEFACCVREAIRRRRGRRFALWAGWGLSAAAAAAIVVAFVLGPGRAGPAGGTPAPLAGRSEGTEGERAAALAPPKGPAGSDGVPVAAHDLEAVRRDIAAVESRTGGRMPGVVPVGAGVRGETRAFLGVYAAEVKTAEGEARPEGVLVADVVAGSPAALGGIRRGDIILKVNGEAVGSDGPLRLRQLVRRAGPGARASVTYRRGDETREADVVLAGEDVSR